MATEAELRAEEYRASMQRRCEARKRRLDALKGSESAKQALLDKYGPLTGENSYAVEEGCEELGGEQLAN